MRPKGALVPRGSGSSYRSTTNTRPSSSKAIAIGEATRGSAATNSRRKPCLTRNAASAFVAGAGARRGGAFDAGIDSAYQPGREQQRKAAIIRAAEQTIVPFHQFGVSC